MEEQFSQNMTKHSNRAVLPSQGLRSEPLTSLTINLSPGPEALISVSKVAESFYD